MQELLVPALRDMANKFNASVKVLDTHASGYSLPYAKPDVSLSINDQVGHSSGKSCLSVVSALRRVHGTARFALVLVLIFL